MPKWSKWIGSLLGLAVVLALVVVSHVVQYTLVTGLGLVFFAREHLRPRDLQPALAEQASS